MTPFASLGLCAPLLRAVSDLAYEAPTPIQTTAIPAILSGKDVRGSAKTGSGKTAAFVLPILQKFWSESLDRRAHGVRGEGRRLRVLVVVPTRELGAQIADVIAILGQYLPSEPKTCLAVGGLSINPQMMELRGGADIVVATPGRLLDLVDHNALRLSGVETVVLDEADRLLSLGFADELARILALLPPRQNILLSATFPKPLQAIADRLLTDPVRIDIDAGVKLSEIDAHITQRAIRVDAPKRTILLRHLLTTHGWSHVLVFVASRYAADHVVDKLRRATIPAAAIHGDLSQTARAQALADFKARRVKVLVATDLAARGIDVAALPAVVNYDLPRSPVDYVHRIGRTGRAGESGMAVSFVSDDTEPHFALIEKRHRMSIAREILAGFEPTIDARETPRATDRDATDAPRPRPRGLDPHGGVKGKRKSKKDKLREAAALAASSERK